MKVTIWDIDWFYKESFIPNIKCMQLSSYHKQKGDTINFVTDKTHIAFIYDVMYIIKEKSSTPMPERKYINDNRVSLIGKGFKYLKTKTLSPIIVACRPDYLLYEKSGTKYDNANFISFYAGNKLVKNRQDYHNTKQFKKFTIVADSFFWKATDEEINYCLDALKDDKNIAFLEPISLRKLLSNSVLRQKFLALKFGTGTPFKWRNDYGSDVESTKAIIEFMKELQTVTKSNLGFVPIKGREENESLEKATIRCFSAAYLYRTNKLQCIIINDDGYKELDNVALWTRYGGQLSYIEYVLHNYCQQTGILWYNFLNNTIHWRNVQIDMLLYYLVGETWDSIRECLYTQWGNDRINSHKIDFEYIKKNVGVFYRDE